MLAQPTMAPVVQRPDQQALTVLLDVSPKSESTAMVQHRWRGFDRGRTERLQSLQPLSR